MVGGKLSRQSEGSDRSMVAHLGSRFGPVIALIDQSGFHVHPTLPEQTRSSLREQMIGQNTRTILIVEDVPPAKSLSYRRNAVLSLRLTYTPRLAHKSMERNPQLHLYLSDDVGRNVTIVQGLSGDEPTTVDLKMKVRMVRPTLPEDCLLNVQAYAEYRNKQGQWCLNQCGYSNLSLPIALAEGDSYKQKLVVNNSENPGGDSKGQVKLKVTSFTFEGGERVPFPQVDLRVVENALNQAESLVKENIHANRKLCYGQLPASSDSIANVTVFIYQLQSHGYVPGAYFDVFRIPRSNTEYTLNALRLGRERSHLVDGDPETSHSLSLRAFFQEGSRRACLKVIMWALAVYVTSCLYITDEVDHNHRERGAWSKSKVELMESFDNMITRDAGDCEDFTRAILVLAHSIKKDYGVRAAREDKGHSEGDQVMLSVADLLNRFVLCSGLCGVSSMALADLKREQKQGERVELNGHEAAFAIPRATFLKAISRHDPSGQITLYMKEEASRYPRYYQEKDIIYPLEGTGVLNPEPFSKGRQEQALEQAVQEMADRYSMKSMDDARTLFTYDPHGGNNFYKMFVTLMTPEFMVLRGIPVIEFVLYERNEHRTSYRGGKHIGKRGVWFDELLNIGQNEHICLTGCPPFSPEVEKACALLSKDNIPLYKPFAPLVKVKEEWREYERALGGPLKGTGASTKVHYFIPASQMSEQHVKDLLRLASLCHLKVNCRMEPIRQNPNGHQVGNFVVTLSKQ